MHLCRHAATQCQRTLEGPSGPTIDSILGQLSKARLFSKLDTNNGFWKIPPAESSHHLTTFITLCGLFCFNKMPFGISSAPERFQKWMNEILEGQGGVLCLMDDVIIYIWPKPRGAQQTLQYIECWSDVE